MIITDPRVAPPEGAILDIEHPLAQGLVACLLPNAAGTVVDWLRDRSSGPAVVKTAGKFGPCLGNWSILNVQTKDLFFTVGPFSVVAVCKVSTTPASAADVEVIGNPWYISNGSNGGWSITLGFTTTGYAFHTLHNAAPTLGDSVISGGTVTTGDHVLVARASYTVSHRSLWVDGVAVVTDTSAASNPVASTAILKGATHASCTPDLYAGYCYSRFLSVGEIAWLTAEPFPFFRLPVVRSAFPFLTPSYFPSADPTQVTPIIL